MLKCFDVCYLRFDVHVRRALVHHQQLAASQQRARKTQKLSLPDREALAALADLAIQRLPVPAERLLQLGLGQRSRELRVAVLLKRVEVLSDAAAEQGRVLRRFVAQCRKFEDESVRVPAKRHA